MFTQLGNRIIQPRRFTLSASGRFADTLNEIGALVEASRRRDCEEARRLAEAHVAYTVRVVNRKFAELEKS